MPADDNSAVVQVSVNGTTPGGEKWVNVFHVLNPNGPAAAITLADATAITAPIFALYDDIKALLASTFAVSFATVKNMTADRSGEQFEVAPGAAIVGTAVGDPLPSQNAVVISWRTALATRRTRGRTYLAGFAESSMDATAHGLTVANQDVIGNAARTMLTDLTTAGADLVIWSRVEPPLNGDVNLVNNLRVGRIFDTQRRRRNRFNEAYISY